MSELIETADTRATIRRKLLTGVSALALSAYISSAGIARAEDADRPSLWIEFGGQAELMQGTTSPFTAPFMFLTPTPDVYGGKSFGRKQQPSHFAFGGESKLTFQPENSAWVFSASVRYGRSHSNKHAHTQGPQVRHYFSSAPSSSGIAKYAAAFSDTLARHDEHHAILNFSAGKDVGLGAFGHGGVSTINLGARVAQFTAKTNATIYARPNANLSPSNSYFVTFHEYTFAGQAARSFKGIGPSLSWNASTVLAGSAENREFTLDWGIDGAMLFGRQKAKIKHATSAYHFLGSRNRRTGRNVPMYNHGPYYYSRSYRVTVPNVGAFAGVSFKTPHSKVSIGYRTDVFLNAMDTGIDAAKKSNLSFHGPYASISIGLGG